MLCVFVFVCFCKFLQAVNLRCIAKHSENGTAVTSVVRSSANANIEGVIFLCMEWSKLTLTHVKEQMRAGLDYILWRTQNGTVYGDLAKWLAPGTVQAMHCFTCLPRDENITTFFGTPDRQRKPVQIQRRFYASPKSSSLRTARAPPPTYSGSGTHTEVLNVTGDPGPALKHQKAWYQRW